MEQPHQFTVDLGGDEAKDFAHLVDGHFVLAVGKHLVGEGKGVAQASVGLAGYQVQRLRVNLDFFLQHEFLEPFHDGIDRNPFEIIALAAGNDGGQNFEGLSGGKDEEHFFRRFLQRFKQGVERVFGKHVHFVDDIDFPRRLAGRVKQLALKLADVVHAGV